MMPMREAKPNVTPKDLEGELIPPTHPLAGVVWVNPDRMHGTPCFYGTRVPIQHLWDYLEGGDPLDEFLDGFEGVTREQAVAALRAALNGLLASLPTPEKPTRPLHRMEGEPMAPETTWTDAETQRALEIWRKYQQDHDTSGLCGQHVGIDPASGETYFGTSRHDIRQRLQAEGRLRPLVYIHIGVQYTLRPRIARRCSPES